MNALYNKTHTVTFTTFSLIANALFISIICAIVYFYLQMEKEVKMVNIKFDQYQSETKNAISSLKSEIALLNLNSIPPAKAGFLDSVITPISQNMSADYRILLLQIIIVVIILCVVGYLGWSAYSLFLKSFLGKLLFTLEEAGIWALESCGLFKMHQIPFVDKLGNQFIVTLNAGMTRADIYIIPVGKTDKVYLPDYLDSLEKSMQILKTMVEELKHVQPQLTSSALTITETISFATTDAAAGIVTSPTTDIILSGVPAIEFLLGK